MTANTLARMNYIFVDYENVQELDLDLIAGKAVKVFLIVGQRQKSLPFVLIKQIHKYHDQVELIETDGTGRNALDMVLAYQIGLRAKADPEGYFHILSKDNDYDALVKHLRANEIRACRDEAFAKVSALVQVGRLSLDERVQWVAERIGKNKSSRPKRKKSLLANIHAICRKEISEAEAQQILDKMVACKLIKLNPQGVVEYCL
jgi:hypothetical protein